MCVKGRTQYYQYNTAGHLIKHLDSGEVQTEFERDVLGRLQTKQSRLIGGGNLVIKEVEGRGD